MTNKNRLDDQIYDVLNDDLKDFIHIFSLKYNFQPSKTLTKNNNLRDFSNHKFLMIEIFVRKT